MQNTTFAELLGCTAQKFVTEYWGREHIFHPAGAIACLPALPALDSLDDLYFSLELAKERLGVVDGHAAPASGTSLIRPDGRVALDEVHATYRAGKTLLLTHLQNSHLGVARLGRAIEVALHQSGIQLRKEIGANLFLTPPVAQGFKPHYDGHDVLILQLAGSKRWRLFDQLPTVRAGMEGDQVPPDQLGPVRQNIELQQGDVLYLPRGVPHFAQTTTLNSLHLTLSIVPLTWTDIFSEKLSACGKIDRRFDDASNPPIVQVSAAEANDLRKALAKVWLSSLHALPESAPWATSAKDPQAGIRLAQGVIMDSEAAEGGDYIEIRLPGGGVRLGADAAEVLNLMRAGRQVWPGDISLSGRSHEAKLRFFQQLIEIGLAARI